MRIKADLTLLFVSISWGSAFAFQRIAGEQGAVYFFNGLRFLLSGLILLPFIRKRGSPSREQWLWMGLAGVILFIASAFQQVGIQYTTAGNAGFITSLYVVIVPFVLLIGWRERPRWLAVAAVVMAGVGHTCFQRVAVSRSGRVMRWNWSGRCSGQCILSFWESLRYALRLSSLRRDSL